jgi:iron complex transport system ATP-binding protein
MTGTIMNTPRKSEDSRPILEVQDLSAAYDGSKVLHGLSFKVTEGEFLGIAGPNGAGKSTLLRTLAALLEPTAGTISIYGKPLNAYSRRHLAQKIAVIFQDFHCPYDFTVYDMVAMGRSPFLPRWKRLSPRDGAIISHAMRTTDVSHLRDRSFFELSGGERQRVVIAKALAQQPSILLLDEPATHLDLHHQVNVFNILRCLNRQKRVTILCITHDLTLGAQYMDRFLLLSKGQLLAEGTPAEVIQEKLIANLFETPVYVGTLGGAGSPYVYPLAI